MKKSNRNARLASDIKKLLSEMISGQLANPNILPLTSVTHVDLTRDLSYATVYISVMDPSTKQSQIDALTKSKGYLRTLLAAELTTFRTPDLIFKYDETLQQANRIERILNDLKISEKEDSGSADEEDEVDIDGMGEG